MWAIHDIPLMDKYGFTQQHQHFTIDIDDNYVDTLPVEMKAMSMAIQYGEQWHIDWRTVLDMPYAEFYEAMLVTKAINYKRPWWTGAAGEQAFVYEKSTSKQLTKPRRRT